MVSAAPKTHSSFAPYPRWRNLAVAVSLFVYFICFNWGSLRVHFALDDLGNIGHYYEYSPWQMVLSNFLPWRGDSRPLAGLYYIPIYHFAGLNPVPYQAVLLLIVLATVYATYYLARLLGSSALAAWLAAIVVCYHGGIANLYYNAAFVFDALCALFYVLTLAYYIRIRRQGDLLGAKQTITFLALFLCALNSKEMAVTIPIMILVYEWLYHPLKDWRPSTLLAWLPGPGRIVIFAGLLDLADIYGKLSGPTAMTHAESYHPVFTLGRLRDFQVVALHDITFHSQWTPGWPGLLVIYAALAYLAWLRSGPPILRFLFWLLIFVPIPLDFLVGKSQACLTIMMIAVAMFIAVVFTDATSAITDFLGRGFRFEPLVRQTLTGALVAAVLYFWVGAQIRLRRDTGGTPMTSLGFETWDIIEQMRASTFHPRPHTSAIFVEDPFHSLDMYFLARLWFDERSVTLHVPSQGPLTDAELAKADYIFAIRDRRLLRLR